VTSFVLAHLSDAHIGPLPKPLRRELLNKRFTGYVNWMRRAHIHDMKVLGAIVAGLDPSGADGPGLLLFGRVNCMPPPSDRTTAFQSMVVFRLGPAGVNTRWNGRTAIPTLATFDPIRAFAARHGLLIEPWLFNDRALGPLEACQASVNLSVGICRYVKK
jgi:hypothetical protein